MLVSQKLNDELNTQIGLEFGAESQYLAMGAYFESRSLSHLAEFFFKQAEEEHEHGMKIMRYLLETGGKAIVPAIAAPQVDFSSAEEVAELFLKQEQFVTGRFYQMAETAQAEKDFATLHFLQWFIEEQVEEESTATKLLDVIRMAGEGRLLQVEMIVRHWNKEEEEGEE